MENNINIKPEELAYLAGYIDADGYIGVTHIKKRNIYKLRLDISASRRDILEDLQAILNVGGYIWTGKNRKDALRYVSKLQYADQQARKVCEMVQPYLRLKGAQAILLIQMAEWRSRHANGMGFNVDAYYAPRYEEMKRLNEGNKSEKVR